MILYYSGAYIAILFSGLAEIGNKVMACIFQWHPIK